MIRYPHSNYFNIAKEFRYRPPRLPLHAPLLKNQYHRDSPHHSIYGSGRHQVQKKTKTWALLDAQHKKNVVFPQNGISQNKRNGLEVRGNLHFSWHAKHILFIKKSHLLVCEEVAFCCTPNRAILYSSTSIRSLKIFSFSSLPLPYLLACLTASPS